MRKTLVSIMLALGIFVSHAAAENDIHVGLNLVNSIDGANGAETDFFSPVVFWDSYLFIVPQVFGIGSGIGFIYSTTSDKEFAWMWTSGEDDYTAANYIMPLYGSLKFYIPGMILPQVYAKLNLGYAFWWAEDGIDTPCSNSSYSYSSDASGGFYFGLGAGVKFGILSVELNYSNFTGHINTTYWNMGYRYHYTPDLDFNFLNLSVGLTF